VTLEDLVKKISPELEDEAGLEYKAEYQVVVECKDEAQQQEAYELLTAKGYSCKVLSL